MRQAGHGLGDDGDELGLPAQPGRHVLQVDFDYDGDGFGKGGTARLSIDGKPQAEGRLKATPLLWFSIHETFDIGLDRGSVAGHYPKDRILGYPFHGGRIERVDVRLR